MVVAARAGAPVWGYRITQGVHVATGTAAIPLLFLKLWSVYPNLFRWPPLTSVQATRLERLSVASSCRPRWCS